MNKDSNSNRKGFFILRVKFNFTKIEDEASFVCFLSTFCYCEDAFLFLAAVPFTMVDMVIIRH